jgi:hypothetical protein
VTSQDQDNDSDDSLYIDEATAKNEGVSPHILYVHALCNREIKDYSRCLNSYLKIMIHPENLNLYEKVIEKENLKKLELKVVEGPGSPGWQIDMYNHLQRLELLQEGNMAHMIDLSPCFETGEGFLHDKVPDVIKTL